MARTGHPHQVPAYRPIHRATRAFTQNDDHPSALVDVAAVTAAVADMLGTTQNFLRALGEARLITPLRSEGGHRRYSRYQLRIAARARELVDQGTPIEAACRIIILEDQLEEAQRINTEHQRAASQHTVGI